MQVPPCSVRPEGQGRPTSKRRLSPWLSFMYPHTLNISLCPLQGSSVRPKISWLLGFLLFPQVFNLWPVGDHISLKKRETKNQYQKISVLLKLCCSAWYKTVCFSPAMLLLFIPSPILQHVLTEHKQANACAPTHKYPRTKIWILLSLITNHHLW